jgi:hypothetical protein
MGKLKIGIINTIKRSNRNAIMEHNKNIEKNTSRHFAKLHGGFDNPIANLKLKKLTTQLKELNSFLRKHVKNKQVIMSEIKSSKLKTQDKINEIIQDTTIGNIKRAFGEEGFTNSNLTKGQIEQIETRQKQLLTELNTLHFEKRNLAIKEMTRNITRIVNHYLGDEVYKKDSRTDHILVNHILKSFKLVENKYLK